MSASYPSSKKTFSQVVNGVTKIIASLWNSAYDEIEAIESELGSNPKGISADVVTRLNGYDSGWFAIASANTYVKDHNLGTTKVLATLMVSDNADGSGKCYIMGACNAYDGANFRGTWISALSTTQVTVATCPNYLFHMITGEAPTTGYARILLLPLE